MISQLKPHVTSLGQTGGASASEQDRYRRFFDNAAVALWDEDFSEVCSFLEKLRQQDVTDIKAYFEAHPQELTQILGAIKIHDVNRYAVELFDAESKDALISQRSRLYVPETYATFLEALVSLWEGRREFRGETVIRTLKGRTLHIAFTITWQGERLEHALVSILDVSQQKSLQRRFEALAHTARVLSTDLDLERIVQSLTDVATQLSGAEFGAFFYNLTDAKGESYILYTISGVPREAFSKFPLPRNTAVFGPTFKGEGVVRSDDIRKDPRYGHNAPHTGMPEGHLPVVSYLAVPVISRSGEVHGGLFLGHKETGIFTNEAEEIVVAIAAQAAVAIDNARLMQTAQRELSRRRENEEATQRLAAIVQSSDDAIIGKDLNGIIQSWNTGAERIFGYSAEEVIGKPVTILIPPERINEESEILSRVRGGARLDHFETIRRRKDGTLIDISLTVSPVRNDEGTIIGASKIARDISDRRKMENHRELMMAELSHRVKNTLATVISIERLSFSNERDVAAARRIFRARIHALAHAHGRLAESNWFSASLKHLIEDELAPYSNSEIKNTALSGPAVNLSAQCALSLGLALHELATNAAKYGALSTPNGRITVTWRMRDDNGGLELEWTEFDGPPVVAPKRSGFGRMLLEQALEQEVGCNVTMDFRPEGLKCTILIPRSNCDLHFG